MGGTLTMQVFITAILVCAALMGCGRHTEVIYHPDTPQEVINAKFGYPAYGYAEWKYIGNPFPEMKVKCDIYLLPYELYKDDACYQAVNAHERRHCYEGDFHPRGATEGFEPACMASVNTVMPRTHELPLTNYPFVSINPVIQASSRVIPTVPVPSQYSCTISAVVSS